MRNLFIVILSLVSFCANAQYDYLSAKKILVSQSFRPGPDTTVNPLWVGEIRQSVEGGVGKIWICISLTGQKWQQISGSGGGGGDVASVFGRTGAVSALQADYAAFYEPIISTGTTLQYIRGDKSLATLNTSIVPESGNLYFTSARARGAITLTTTGTSGSATYNSTTGVFNIPQIDTNLLKTHASHKKAIDSLGALMGGGGGTPGGSDTQVQFNDGGSFGGDGGFTYNKTTNTINTDSIAANRLRAEGAMLIPIHDTTTAGVRPGDMTYTGGQAYMWSGTRWETLNINASNLIPSRPKMKIIAGIMRPTIPGSIGQPIVWEWLGAGSDHDTIYISPHIEATSSGSLKVYYPSFDNVITFVPQEDDRFKRFGTNIGASVATDYAEMIFYRRRPQIVGYYRGNGTSWTANGELTSGIDFNYSSGSMKLNVTAGLGISDVRYEGVTMEYSGAEGYRMKKQLSGLGAYNVGFQIVDAFGNNVALTPQTTDVVVVNIPGGTAPIITTQNRSTTSDEFIDGSSAIFIFGVMEELDNPHRLVGTPTATAASSTQINLTWPSITSGAGTYTVQRSTTQNFHTSTTVYTGTATSYSDTGLTTGTRYYYRVRHTRTSDSARSDMLTMTAITP